MSSEMTAASDLSTQIKSEYFSALSTSFSESTSFQTPEISDVIGSVSLSSDFDLASAMSPSMTSTSELESPLMSVSLMPSSPEMSMSLSVTPVETSSSFMASERNDTDSGFLPPLTKTPETTTPILSEFPSELSTLLETLNETLVPPFSTSFTTSASPSAFETMNFTSEIIASVTPSQSPSSMSLSSEMAENVTDVETIGLSLSTTLSSLLTPLEEITSSLSASEEIMSSSVSSENFTAFTPSSSEEIMSSSVSSENLTATLSSSEEMMSSSVPSENLTATPSSSEEMMSSSVPSENFTATPSSSEEMSSIFSDLISSIPSSTDTAIFMTESTFTPVASDVAATLSSSFPPTVVISGSETLSPESSSEFLTSVNSSLIDIPTETDTTSFNFSTDFMSETSILVAESSFVSGSKSEDLSSGVSSMSSSFPMNISSESEGLISETALLSTQFSSTVETSALSSFFTPIIPSMSSESDVTTRVEPTIIASELSSIFSFVMTSEMQSSENEMASESFSLLPSATMSGMTTIATSSLSSEVTMSSSLLESLSTDTRSTIVVAPTASLETSSPSPSSVLESLTPSSLVGTSVLETTVATTIIVPTSSAAVAPSSSSSSSSSVPLSISPTPSSTVTQPPPPSTTPTTPTTTSSTTQGPSTVATIDNSKNDTEYWVVSSFRVRTSVDVQSASFQDPVEQGLAECYHLANIREEEVQNGTYVPLYRRRKRLANAAGDPNIKVDIVSAKRDGNTPAVDVIHVVEEKGQLLTATAATEKMNLLSDQEVAIQTGHVVSQSAKPYITPTSKDAATDWTMWIIIGCVIGGVVLISIVIIVVCLCCCGGRYCKKSPADKVGVAEVPESPITKVAEVGKSTQYVEEEGSKGSTLTFNPRKGKYSVNADPEEEDPLYSQAERQPPTKAPRKKKISPQGSAENQDARIENERRSSGEGGDGEGTPKKKKKKKKKGLETEEDIQSIYQDQIASLNAAPTMYTQPGDFTLTSQPTLEDEGDLLENAEEERKKNKQRLRAKKMKEKEHQSPSKSQAATEVAYENAQKEIDKVLGPRDESDENDKKKKHKDKGKKKKKKDKKGEDNEAYSSDEKKEESLEEARQRMHKLLDDAFSLISHSKSSIGNKVDIAKQSSDEDSSARSSKSQKSHSGKSSARDDHGVQTEIDVRNEKKHVPLFVHRTHEPYDKEGLVSWSPYRASDDTTMISLPTTQTNLNTTPPQQEKITTSTFNENLPSSLRPNFYTTQPGEPIVIKSRNLDSNLPPSGSSSRRGSHSRTNGGNGYPSQSNAGTSQITIQNPVYDSTLPTRSMDKYSEPYYGMSSYQEIPPSTSLNDGRNSENGRGDPSLDRSRFARSAPPGARLRDDGSHHIQVQGHSAHAAPHRGENRNHDEVDVIKESLRPGVSPQPLINSLREELQTLSSRRPVSGNGNGNSTRNGDPDSVMFRRNSGSTHVHGLGNSASGWESMPGHDSTDV